MHTVNKKGTQEPSKIAAAKKKKKATTVIAAKKGTKKKIVSSAKQGQRIPVSYLC